MKEKAFDKMDYEIKRIIAAQTLPIRQIAMWPNKPLEFVQLKNDANGRHYGLFINTQLISVISLFIENQEAQFRKFATLPDYQGKGYGSRLLKKILEIIEQEDCSKIWCNARIHKVSYYHRFGLQQTTTTFKKEEIEYVVMEKVLPSPY